MALKPPKPLVHPLKLDPDEALWFLFNWAAVFGDFPGEAIQTSTWTCLSDTATAEGHSKVLDEFTDTATAIKLTGGTADFYDWQHHITTLDNNGRTQARERTIRFVLLEK